METVVGLMLVALSVVFGAAAARSLLQPYEPPHEFLAYIMLATGCIFIGTAMLPMNKVKAAEFYGIVGAGTSTLEQVKLDKWWYQEAFDHRWEEKSNVWKAGAGWNVGRYVALEVDYRDLGRFNSVARWVGQEDFYNPITNQCEPEPCPPRQTAYGTGTVKGVVLSVLLKYPVEKLGGLTPYARLGIIHFEQSYNVYHTPDPGQEDGNSLRTWHEGRQGVSPVYGLGVQYKWVWAEFTQYHSVASKNSAFQNASTFMMGVNVPF